MVPNTQVSGLVPVVKVMESKSGQMVLDTMECGMITWLMDKASFIMPMEMCMKDNGRMIKPADLVYTLTLTELSMKATGKMTYKTAKEKKPGLMGQSIKACTRTE